ncbi:hypothetical protein [Pararhizobium sp. A13]|uniref:hypothetical protein n=1 Tax=Pararhizobium sp. A13 TaxID=3133975 RepID=UPI00311B2B78
MYTLGHVIDHGANEIAKLSLLERRRLVERALLTITDQRHILTEGGNVTSLPSAVLLDIKNIMGQFDNSPDFLASLVLMECADEIRKLHILIAES